MGDIVPACLRIVDVAARWSCSPGKVRALIKCGALPCLRLGTMLRVPVAALTAYEAQCQQMTPPASAGSPDATPGTSTTGAVASLLAARAVRRLNSSSPNTSGG